MKLEVRIKVLCAAMAMVMLFASCRNAIATQEPKMETTENVEVIVENENEEVTVEKEEVNIVTTPSEEIVEELTEETTEEEVTEEVVPVEPTLTPEELEQQEWQNYMMPNVEESLNVRVKPNVDADIAGILEKGDRATVLEIGLLWTKIESGNLVGYVSNEYCLYGADALAYAKQNCKTIATTTTAGLRIREQMSLESAIIRSLDEGDRLLVDTSATTEAGWVAVRDEDATYYVSADYVTVSIEVGTGITIEEIEEIAREEERRRAEEEERRAREEQAKREAAEKVARDNSAMREIDELTLMAAIIYCEAGAEPYETQVAVGAVIMNRIKSDRFPNNLYDVLSQNRQFMPYRTGVLAKALANGSATESCYEAARATLFGGEDNTDGCLFFNDYYGTQEGIRYGGMVFWW